MNTESTSAAPVPTAPEPVGDQAAPAIKQEEAVAALRLVGQACAAYHGNRTDHISLERALKVLDTVLAEHFG